MSVSDQQAKSLLKAIYFLIFVVFVNIAMNLYYFLNPTISQNIDNEKKQYWHLKSISRDIPDNDLGKKISYGYQLITETSSYIGPLAKSTAMRFAGNNLSCNNYADQLNNL